MREELHFVCRDAVPNWHRVPAFSVSRGWGEGEKGREKRKQEKGNVPWTSLSDCLHIVFPRDIATMSRDRFSKNGANPPFAGLWSETPALGRPAR